MPSSDLCFASALDLAGKLRRKEVSAVELLEAHLAQIERVDPAINAVVTRTPELALAQAKACDAAIMRGETLGPLHGLPVAHKDLQATKGIRTTWGSKVFEHWVPDFDTVTIERLKAAGAVQVGKTNVPEFGAGSQSYNPVFGATRNPYDPAKTAGGSSGGAGAALAAGLVPIADGSDMGGSLRNPGNFNNVVGFRPSPGRIPRAPTRDAWSGLSVDGPMARSVADCAFLFAAMAGPDRRAPLSLDTPGAAFAGPLGRDFKGVRVAFASRVFGLPLEPRVRAAFLAQRAVLEAMGCIVEDAEPDVSGADEAFMAGRHVTFHGIVAAQPPEKRALFKPEIQWHVEEARKLSALDLAAAQDKRGQLYERWNAFMDRHEFLVLPVSQVLPFDVATTWPRRIDGVEMRHYLEWMKSCWYPTCVEPPAISVPAAFVDGLPFGLQIVGRHHDDFGVLQFGHAFEEAAGHVGRQRPTLAA